MAYLCRFVISPIVKEEAIIKLVAVLRSREKEVSILTLRSLENKRPRSNHAKLAKSVNARTIEYSGRVPRPILLEEAAKAFGNENFLFCEANDRVSESDICMPGPGWLEHIFKVQGLEWLVDVSFCDNTSWEAKRFFVYPGNPPDWDATLPINARLLKPAIPGQPRDCPACGKSYVSHFLRSQCRDPECRFYYQPFESLELALAIAKVSVDKDGDGRCSRCNLPHSFVYRIEQHEACGQLLEAENDEVILIDNRSDVAKAISALCKPVKSMTPAKPWWRIW